MPDLRLDAETDKLLAELTDALRHLDSVPGGDDVPRSIAGPMRGQFPDTPRLGRILVAASQALGSLDDVCTARGVPVDKQLLLSALAFAGAMIERQETTAHD